MNVSRIYGYVNIQTQFDAYCGDKFNVVAMFFFYNALLAPYN